MVVRNGLIEAVGENVAVPADALGDRRRRAHRLSRPDRRAEHVGHAGAAAGAARRTRGAERAATTAARRAAATPPRVPRIGRQTTSWIKAADDDASRTTSASKRRATQGSPPRWSFRRAEFSRGQGSIVNLAGEKAGGHGAGSERWANTSPSHTSAGFGGGFPSALMGVIAYMRQIYLDADHYQLVKDGLRPRPARDAAAGIRPGARRRAGIASAFCCRRIAGWRSTACCGSRRN